MEKFQNKYRIPSARLSHWDYGSAALYFITICTKNREHYFGEIVHDKDALPCVSLSPIGEIVKSEWLKTFEMRPDMNLWMGEFVVMPNHFHGIIGIGENEYNTKRGVVDGVGGRDAMHCVSTRPASETNRPKNQFGPQSKNLASVVRGFKIGVTKNARSVHADFEWQSRFHDHIIRDDKSFQKISDYIINNPAHWQEDKFFKT
jgi:putative transposase